MFLEAQVVTQEINRGNIGLQGQVYLYRTTDDAQTTDTRVELNYWQEGYEDFIQKVEENDTSLINYYCMDNQGRVVIAGLETTTVQRSRREEGSSLIDRDPTTTENKVTTYEIDYKNMISQYTTPMSFFITLGIHSNNPKFLEAVAQLVKERAKIELTVINTISEEVTVQVDKYTEHTTEREVYWGPDNMFTEPQITTTTTSRNIEQTTTTTVTTRMPSLRVTYADTWVCTQSIEYKRLPDEVLKEAPTTIEQTSDSKKELSSDTSDIEKEAMDRGEPTKESVSWTTREDSDLTSTTTTKAFDNGTPSDYIDNTDDFINLLDIEYTLPNSKEKRTAGAYLTTDAEMLFQLLAQNTETQGMEQVMRYIMYKYTKKDYGVTEIDFSIFNPNYFTSYNNGIIGGNIEEKVWYTLRNLGYSEYAVAGVLGNFKWESGGTPSAVESNGEGIGLGQWSYGRKEALINYATSKGKTWEDENIQIEFLIGELTPGGGADGYATYNFLNVKGYNGDKWKNASSAADAATAFCYSFERPGNPSGSLPTRIRYAEEYYQKYKGMQMYAGATDSVTTRGYTFPHYLQRNYDYPYGTSTISAAGCGPTSLAMLLAGITKNPGINSITVVKNMESYYPNYKPYYLPGAGTIYGGMLNNDLLEKYYNVKATAVSSEEAGIKEIESGKVAIGSVSGHVIAIVPVPEQYQGQGYRFYIMDSARGLDGPYRSGSEVRAKPRSGGVFYIRYIIEPK